MLTIHIPSKEMWDEDKQEFKYTKAHTLVLEHSLVSMSKWESKWCKPFLSSERKTIEETIDYIKCMTITQNVDDDVYSALTTSNIDEINAYIQHPMTATVIVDNDKSSSKEIVTSELIYYWMISFNIPFECQKWHLNRLITLIRLCNKRNKPPKKLSQQELIKRNSELNAIRRKRLQTKG